MRTMRSASACTWVLWGIAAPALAAQLSPDQWTVQDSNEAPLKGLTDGSLETACTLKSSGRANGLSVTVDLQSPHLLHRVYWCGNTQFKEQGAPERKPRGQDVGAIAVFVGESPKSDQRVAEVPIPAGAESPCNAEGDVRFPPTPGRYVRLEVQKVPTDFAWVLGEIEIHGFSGPQATDKGDAVVLPGNAPGPLFQAARDLSYYLGELTGRPHPIVAPEQAKDYPGALYRIEDLKPLAPTYEELVRNQEAGKFPKTPVNVERRGREVIFRAWPYRNVLWSVWEFLERQGVRWVYPDPHGDFVPESKGVNLDLLPLQYTPSADCIYANFDVSLFLLKDPYQDQPPAEAFLYFWRNRYTTSWNHPAVLGGSEVPQPKESGPAVRDEYKEGFAGYPHNFNSVVPDRVLREHRDWLGLVRDERFGKENAGKRAFGPAPCFTNAEMIQFVADKAIAWAGRTPGAPRRFNLLPLDDAIYCECDQCLALNQPLVVPDIPYCAHPTYWGSDGYYHFVCEVAQRVRKAAPQVTLGALAYANVTVPPRKIATFPDNVVVQVCQYGAPNLPLDAPANARMKAVLEDWARKCKRLENYDYVLLNESKLTWPMPAPLVRAIVDRAKFLHKLGALAGGTQAEPHALRYNPWNFYVYPRILWNADQTSDQILKEFFAGCFRESGDALRAYYRTAEDYHVAKGIDLHFAGYWYNAGPGAYPYQVLQTMAKHLDAAEKAARSWIVKRRLEPMRRGFTWLLQASGLTLQDLASPDKLPVMGPACQPLKITPPIAHILPSERGQACMLYSGSAGRRIGHHIRFEQAGQYLVKVQATGYEREKRGAKQRDLVVNVGAERFGPVDVPDGPKEFAVTVTAPAGVWELSVQCPQNAGPVGVKEFTVQPKP